MIPDYLPGKTQANSGSFSLGGVEGNKNLLKDVVRNPAAVIGDTDDQKTILTYRGADSNTALLFFPHRIGGIGLRRFWKVLMQSITF